MTSKGHALAREELVRALIAYTGIATEDGLANGTTIVDAALIGKNDFVTEKTILIMTGDAAYEDRGASSFDNTTGTITVASAFKDNAGADAQIKAGTIYRILNISTVEIDVEAINTKVGTNTDAAGTTTLFARLKQIVDTYLANGTIGLAALKALIAAIPTTAERGTDNAALASVLGALDTAAATGAVSDVKKAMAYLKQLVTELIVVDGLIGTINTTTTDSLHGKLGTDTELADYSFYDLLGGNAFKTNALSAMLGAFTTAQNLKAILGDLSSTKRLGQILGLDETDTLKAILGAFTAAQNLKAILGDLTTTKNLGGILGAFTTANNLKALLGALTTTNTLKAILGGYTAAASLKDAIDAITAAGPTNTQMEAARDAVIAAIPAMVGTDNAALASVLGALDTAAATGAVSNVKMAMAYIKQLVTAIIALTTAVGNIPTTMVGTDNAALASVLGALDTAAATGAVSDVKMAMAYIKQLVTAILLIPTTAMRGTDSAALASVCTEVRLAELAAANIPADIDGLKTSRDRQLFTMDFWSLPQEEVAITNVAGDKALPSVVVAEVPGTIVRAIAMFKFRMVEAHTYAGVNKLSGAQEIQVKEAAAGAWTDAINFVDDMFTLAQDTREGGDVIIGVIDVSAVEVDGNDTYSFQWDQAVADQDGINFNDVQVGLRIWYSV